MNELSFHKKPNKLESMYTISFSFMVLFLLLPCDTMDRMHTCSKISYVLDVHTATDVTVRSEPASIRASYHHIR